jgi:hypothetical protein
MIFCAALLSPLILTAPAAAAAPPGNLDDDAYARMRESAGLPPEKKAPPASKGINAYMGNYGYMLEYPSGYTVLPGFSDPEKTMETVLFFPKGTPPDKLSEPFYGKLGIMRVEAAPIIARTPRGTFRAGLKELRAAIPDAIKRGGEKCVVSDFHSPFPGAKFTISGGTPLVQVVLEGAKVTYIFTAAKDDAALRTLIKSLKEIAPTDKPGL